MINRLDHKKASCDGKEVYTSYDSAYRAKGRCDRKGKPAKVYRCDHCHKWHLATLRTGPTNHKDEADIPQKGDYLPTYGIRIS